MGKFYAYPVKSEDIFDMMRIDNWKVVLYRATPYVAPELGSSVVVGNVYGNEKFSDGDKVTTSTIKSLKNGYLETVSGSKYKLLNPSDKWLEWLKENDYKVEDFFDK